MIGAMMLFTLPIAGRIARCSGLWLVLALAGCNSDGGLIGPGSRYPGELAAYAPRMGTKATYTYYPRYEAYYDHAAEQFCYPNGDQWESKPTVLGSTTREVFNAPKVPFAFPDHPSRYHWQVKQAYPTNWPPASDRPQQAGQLGQLGQTGQSPYGWNNGRL